MKRKYSVNMSEILKDTLIKKTDTFNFAKARGNNKRINSNKPRYTFEFENSLILSVMELYFRLREFPTPPWGKYYVVNKPTFKGFDEQFTNKFFNFCNYLDNKLLENDDKVKLSQAQVYTIFDILTHASVIHDKLKRNKTNLFKDLSAIKVNLFLRLKMKDLRDDSFILDTFPLLMLKKAEILY